MSIIYGNMVGGSSGPSVAVDATLSVSGQAADAKAVGDAIQSLSAEIDGKISKEEDPTVSDWAKKTSKPNYAASEIDVSFATADGSMNVHSVLKYILSKIGEDVVENPYKAVTWNTTAFAAGEVDEVAYYGWCPHNLQYDKTRGKFVFLQCRCTGHVSGATWYTPVLSYLDPENPTEYEPINCPVVENTVAALLIEDDGTWYIWTSKTRYISHDGGISWESETITGLGTTFGVWKVGDTLYMGDDSSSVGVYCTSTDGGLNWTTENFGDVGAYSDCEASFCEFKGETYAFLRTNTTDYAVVLKKVADGWALINDDKILCYKSSCCPVQFGDYIAIANCNRRDQHLYYTVWDGSDDWYTEDLGSFSDGKAGDFHTAALAFGDGYAAVAFFTHSNENSEYRAAINAWVVGAYSESKSTLLVTTENYSPYIPLAETTEIYPADAETVDGMGTHWRYPNPNSYPVSLYNSDNQYLEYGSCYALGSMILVMNGKLISFERGYMSTSSQSRSSNLNFVRSYNKYPILHINGKYYEVINNVIHRKNKIILGAELENIFPTDIPTRINYLDAGEYFVQNVGKKASLSKITLDLLYKTKITLSATSLNFSDTTSQTITAADSGGGTVTWRSDNTSVATVDVSTGVITPKADGTCHIIANCGQAMSVCSVTVKLPTESSS